MTPYNIKIKNPNFTINDGYFYTFIHENEILYKKNTEGEVVFTYPIEGDLDNREVLEACCDGINFWTLQRSPHSSRVRIIKKWRIENYVCKLLNSYTFGDSSNNYFYSKTFSLEYFLSSLREDTPKNSTVIKLNDFAFDIPSGSLLTIGPNADGEYEEVTVTGTLNDFSCGLDFYTSKNHSAGEKVSLCTGMWIFNNYLGTSINPNLSHYNLITNEIDYQLLESNFQDITGSTFYTDKENKNYVLYVHNTSLRYFDIESKTVTKTFTMDNIRTNNTTIIPVHGLEVENDTLYRLQDYVNYFETNYDLSTYNYQCSTLRSFIDSITMQVYPKILPANGMSQASVTTVIQDQYGDPAVYKRAHVSDDDPTGYLTIQKPSTNLQGIAKTYYRAGLSVREVTITSFATQYD